MLGTGTCQLVLFNICSTFACLSCSVFIFCLFCFVFVFGFLTVCFAACLVVVFCYYYDNMLYCVFFPFYYVILSSRRVGNCSTVPITAQSISATPRS